MRRRTLLGWAAGASLAGVAGCGGRDGTDGDRATGGNPNGDHQRTERRSSDRPVIDLPWTQLPGPPGGPVSYLSVSGADSDWIYATTRTSGMFVTSNGGEGWRQGFSGQHHRPRVWASPHDPETAYTQIERTDDGGATWYGDHTNSDRPDRDRHGPVGGLDNRIYRVAWSPHDEDTVYAATPKGFYRSTDDGRSWERESLGHVDLPPDYRGWDFAVHPDREGVVIAGASRYLARSSDHGATWSVEDLGERDERIRDRFVRSVTFAGPDTDDVYLAVGGVGLFERAGGNLVELSSDLPPIVFSQWFDPDLSADGQRLYFVAGRDHRTFPVGRWWDDRTLYVFDRSGGRVAPVQTPVKPSAVATDPADPDTVYVGGTAWVWESTDRGASWTRHPDGFVDRYLATVGVNPTRPETVVVGSNCSTGVTVSRDRGETYEWKRSGVRPWHQGEFGEHYVMQIAAGGDRVYATTAAGLLYSRDNGRSFRLLDNRFSGRGEYGGTYTHLHGLAVDPDDPAVVYVGTGIGGAGAETDAFAGRSAIWRSDDGGESWREVTTGYPSDRDTVVQDVVVSRFDTDVVYAGTNAEDYLPMEPTSGYGVFRSTDRGERWRRLDTPFQNVHAITEDAERPGWLFASTPQGVFRSTDGGDSWESVLSYATQALLAHPTEPEVVFAAAQEYPRYWDVLVSTDGGDSWAAGDLTIQVGREADVREADAVEAHSHYWGHNGEVKWFAADPAGSFLYAATNGTGLWRAELPDGLAG